MVTIRRSGKESMLPFKLTKGIADESTLGQMRFFWRMLDGPKSQHSVTRYFVLITFVIGAAAVTQVQLNNWQGSIYDAIGQRDLSVFLHEIRVFLTIISILLCLGVLQTWLHERIKVRLRKAVTLDLLDEWLQPKRAFLLPLTGEISINPDQRIQEDTRRLSELSVDLAVGLVQSTLMLLAFVGGAMNLIWMGIAAGLMALEKLPSIGRPLTKPLGILLLGGAIYAAWIDLTAN